MPGCSEMPPALSAFLIERNAKEIARNHEQFEQTLSLPWMAKWVGTLTPLFQEYVVEIEFTPGAADGSYFYPPKTIWVTVLDPMLTEREEPPTRIPHLYRYPTDEETPRLCLFWPKGREWTNFMSIAEFIIPWATEWLANYELWKVTGRWPSPEAPHDVVPSNVPGIQETPSDPRVTRAGSASENWTPILPLRDGTALSNLQYFFERTHPAVTT